MNWFKRYGIVGAYFLCTVCAWYIFFSGSSLPIVVDKETSKVLIDGFPIKDLVGIATFLFLPAGYIIMVISQWMYYRGLSLSDRPIHRRIYNSLPQRLRQNIQRVLTGMNLIDSEHIIESMLTYMARIDIKTYSQEQIKSLNDYNRKRFDVIAMNNGLVWATILAFFVAIYFKLLVCKITWQSFMLLLGGNLVKIIFVIFIIILAYSLRQINQIMEDQIFIIESLKFRGLGYEGKIRRLAYAFSEKRKSPGGDDKQDWIEAEAIFLELQE